MAWWYACAFWKSRNDLVVLPGIADYDARDLKVACYFHAARDCLCSHHSSNMGKNADTSDRRNASSAAHQDKLKAKSERQDSTTSPRGKASGIMIGC
eukprot:4129231-Amphidinium_carterae.2